MNGNPYTSSFIGATNQYPIYDYINSNIISTSNYTLDTSNILELHSSNYTIANSNILQTQITGTCNLVYKDNDCNTILRISAQNIYYPISGNPIEMRFQNVENKYITKITQTGELFVYHPTAPLPTGYGPGWWSVENKLANCITDGQGLRFDVTNLQAATGATAITDATTASGAVAGAVAGVASATATTATAGTAIAGGDYGSVALGLAGGALFSVLGYLSYQAQVESNLSNNGFTTQGTQVHSNINTANLLIASNISNICIATGFLNCNILKLQTIPNLSSSSIIYKGNEISSLFSNTSNFSSNYASNLNINTSNYASNLNINTSNYASNLNINTSNYASNLFSNLSNITNTSNIYNLKKINILLPTSNWSSDTTNLYYYDLDLRNYIPTVNINGFSSRMFRITSTQANADYINKRNYYFQGNAINIPETLTIFHNNSSNYLGQTQAYVNDAYNNGIIIGKSLNTNIGTWNLVPNNFNYLRYLSYVAGDVLCTLENLTT